MDKAPDTPGDSEADLARREADYERFVWDNLKRNYAGNYLHGMLGMTGFRLFNAPTFLPAYLHTLSGSDAIVGLGLGLQQLGGVISPIFGATHIEHRPKVLPVSVLLGTLMRVQILGVALAGLFLSQWPTLMLVVTLVFLFLLGLFSGPQRVAFQLLMAKVIPISRRGRLQAWRNVTGGIVAAGLSFMAGRYIIDQKLFGNGYATTFLLAFVLTSLGLTALRLLLREPELPSTRPKTTVRERMKDFPAMVMGDRNFFFFLSAQLLTAAGRISAPFFILFAGQTVELTGGAIGLLTLAFLGADTAMNLIWGYAGDKFGFRSTFITSLVIWIASIALLFVAKDLTWIVVAYCGLGAAMGGWMMSSTTMVLEFGQREDIAMRLALLTTLEGVMSAAGPVLGGILAATLGYPVLFGISMGILATALFLLTVLVKEPRNRRVG